MILTRLNGGRWIAQGRDGVCPDILRFEQFCGADAARGLLVLCFFWLMQAWPARGTAKRVA